MADEQTFQLTVRTEICALWDGRQSNSDRLTMAQDLTLTAGDMMELFGILSQFNDLAKAIKAEKV